MPVVRVYLPLDRSDLDQLSTRGELPAGPGQPVTVYAVTPALERSAPDLDLDGLEYAAFGEAVRRSGAARTDPSHRRVVAAADVDPAWVAPDVQRHAGSTCALTLSDSVPLSRFAAFHVDESGGVEGSGDLGGDDELLWYDATELDEVRGLFA